MSASSPNIHNEQTALFALCLGFFMVIIDVTIVNVALPTIAIHLNGQMSDLQWIIASYSLTFASFLLTAGNLADRIGAKKAYLWGLGSFILTSLGCGLSTTSSMLIGFRLLQGASGALLIPTSLTLINQIYTHKEKRDRAIGVWAAVGGIAAALGPFLGGVLITRFGWQAVFFVNVPIGIASILLTYKTISHSHITQKKGQLDIPGQLLAIICIGALAFSLIEIGKSGLSSILTLSSIAIFLVSLFSFIYRELRCAQPMFPLAFFKSSQFSASNVIAVLLNLGFYGELFVLPLYFQQVRLYSPFESGMALLPFVAFVAISSYIAGKIASVAGPRLPMVVGLILSGTGFLLMCVAGTNGPAYIVLILPMAMIGFGSAFTMPAATIAAISALPHDRAGIASGAFNACRQIGGLIGVALFGTIINASHYFINGMHITLIVAALGYFFASLLSLFFIKIQEK